MGKPERWALGAALGCLLWLGVGNGVPGVGNGAIQAAPWEICSYSCQGGQICIPNAQNFGYFNTVWRRWPGEPRPGEDFPKAVGREVLPTPKAEKPELPMPNLRGFPSGDPLLPGGILPPDLGPLPGLGGSLGPGFDFMPPSQPTPTPSPSERPAEPRTTPGFSPPGMPPLMPPAGETPGPGGTSPTLPSGILPESPANPLPGLPANPPPADSPPGLSVDPIGHSPLPKAPGAGAFLPQTVPHPVADETLKEPTEPQPEEFSQAEPRLQAPKMVQTGPALPRPFPEMIPSMPTPPKDFPEEPAGPEPLQVAQPVAPTPMAPTPAEPSPVVQKPTAPEPAGPAPFVHQPIAPIPAEPAPIAHPPAAPALVAVERPEPKPLQANWTESLHPGFRGEMSRSLRQYTVALPARPVLHQSPIEPRAFVADRTSEPVTSENAVSENAVSENTAMPGAGFGQPVRVVRAVEPLHQPPPTALEGFCPVTLGRHEQWSAGNRRFATVYEGRTYVFAGASQRQAFLNEPSRYAPRCSGNDPVLIIEQNRQEPGSTDFCLTYDNRLYMFASEAMLRKFQANPGRYVGTIPR